MKFCPVVPEICRGQVHGARKERRITRTRRKRIIIIIIRNGAKTISLQTLFGRLNNTFCLSFSWPNMMYLFNSTEWCYIKLTTNNVLQILLQASRWRVKTANTILQIQWKKEKKLNFMQIHLHEVKILQIHNTRPELVKKKISRLLNNQNPAFLYKV